VTDDGGCSTSVVFTGQTASCVGGPAAWTTVTVVVPAPTLTTTTTTTAPTLTAATTTPALAITALDISPSACVPELGQGPAATAARTRGARVTFKLSGAATVRFTMERKLPGREVGGRCVQQTRANRSKRKCTRLAASGSFTRPGVEGSNRFRLTGRANLKPLAGGNYVLVAVAVDAAGRLSKPASHPFRIVR
jgi:hypothetical protein